MINQFDILAREDCIQLNKFFNCSLYTAMNSSENEGWYLIEEGMVSRMIEFKELSFNYVR